MEITIIAILIVLGIIALLLEMFLVPGISIAGISGVLFLALGIAYSFSIDFMYGIYTIVISVVALALSIFYFMKSKTLEKLSLHAEIDGKVETFKDDHIKIGDRGITTSRLAPMGKIKINDITIEAKSQYEFVGEGVEVEVIEINRTNVTVKTISE
jgi:membrane-bound ClpP family serine protease